MYIIYLRHKKATFNWGNRQHPNTKGNKVKDMKDIKEIKRELWEVIFKAQALGASKAVKYAIIDAMIVIDKEAEKSEKTEVCS